MLKNINNVTNTYAITKTTQVNTNKPDHHIEIVRSGWFVTLRVTNQPASEEDIYTTQNFKGCESIA